MAAGLQRNNRRKYAKNSNDHVIFVLVILLSAALYAHPPKSLIKEQSILQILRIAIVLLGLALFVKLLRRLTVRATTRRISDALIDTMSGVEFERYVASLLPDQGFKHVELTEHYDLGLDIIAEKEGVIWGIQVKRQSTPVKVLAVRQVVAALKHYDCDRSMVITNSSFSSPARELALSNNCVLIDRHRLTQWGHS